MALRPTLPKVISSISALPAVPALYALYGGKSEGKPYVAYVGIAGTSLRSRIEQHLIRRDSSIATGVAAVCLNPDAVSEVRWWSHSVLIESVGALEAAELVAFEVLDPALRSRGGVSSQARVLAADPVFADQVRSLLRGEPAGRLILPTLAEALSRIAALEDRVGVLETRLDRIERREESQ